MASRNDNRRRHRDKLHELHEVDLSLGAVAAVNWIFQNRKVGRTDALVVEEIENELELWTLQNVNLDPAESGELGTYELTRLSLKTLREWVREIWSTNACPAKLARFMLNLEMTLDMRLESPAQEPANETPAEVTP